MEVIQSQLSEMNRWNWDQWKTFVKSQYEDFPDSRRDIVPSDPIEYIWNYIATNLGDFYLLVGFYLFMNTCYMIGGIFFWFCDRYKWLDRWKIQTEKYPTNQDYIRCSLNLFQNYILIILPLVYISYPLFRQLGFSSSLPIPWNLFIRDFMFCVIVEDIAHYFLHRALHTPWLYKNIHKVHHTFAAPFGLAASYSHPAEVLILGFATFLGALIIRPHFFTFLCWVLYRQLDAVGTHSGYDIPLPVNWIPFYGGIALHDYHHKSFIWNYSSRFTFMDVMFGTAKDPKKKKLQKGLKK